MQCFLYLSMGYGASFWHFPAGIRAGWLTLVRMMFLLPCYGAGTLYKENWRQGTGQTMGCTLALSWLPGCFWPCPAAPSSTPWPSATVLQES